MVSLFPIQYFTYSYKLIEGFCCGAPLKCDKSLDDIILRGVFYLSKCSRALNREISRCKKQLKKSLLIEGMGHNLTNVTQSADVTL